jgi:hypothetical protein
MPRHALFAFSLTLLAMLRVAAGDAVAADTPAPAAPQADAAATEPGDTEVPSFQPGMWEYQRSLVAPGHDTSSPSRMSRCTDPSREMRARLEELKKKGCRFSPSAHSGDTYRTSWTCPARDGGEAAVSETLTARSKTGYEVVSEAHLGKQQTRSRIIATRTGECSARPGGSRHPGPPPPPSPQPPARG